MPEPLLLKEAVYHAVAVGSYELHDVIDYSSWLHGPLLQVRICLLPHDTCWLGGRNPGHAQVAVSECLALCSVHCAGAVDWGRCCAPAPPRLRARGGRMGGSLEAARPASGVPWAGHAVGRPGCLRAGAHQLHVRSGVAGLVCTCHHAMRNLVAWSCMAPARAALPDGTTFLGLALQLAAVAALRTLVDDFGFDEAAFKQHVPAAMHHLAAMLCSSSELDSQTQVKRVGLVPCPFTDHGCLLGPRQSFALAV